MPGVVEWSVFLVGSREDSPGPSSGPGRAYDPPTGEVSNGFSRSRWGSASQIPGVDAKVSKLVAFLESHFGITIEAHAAGVEHLDTIDRAGALVAAKRAAA